MSDKIAILIPIKNKCKNLEDTFLYNTYLPSFKKTMNKEFIYTFYIGLDEGDIMLKDDIKRRIIKVIEEINCKCKILKFDSSVEKGHVTKMWNILFNIAYKEDNNYFYQCGDDIQLITKDWTIDFINKLQEHSNIGVVGPRSVNGHQQILTQTFVSKEHYKIFNCYFPNVIKNWFCDNWISTVYRINNLFFLLDNHKIRNDGGEPRYNVVSDSLWITKLLRPSSILIYNHIKQHNKVNTDNVIKQNRFEDYENTINFLIHQYNTKYKNSYANN